MADKTNNEAEQKDTIAPKEWALEIAQLISDRHGYDIVILQVGEISPITDYLLIATGTSDRQLVSVADELQRLGKKKGNKVWKVAGQDSGDWVVLDFVDVVVHLFSEDLRRYYDLELIWGEAPRVEWERDEPAENAR